MEFIIVLVCTLAVCLLLRRVIYNFAWIFYILAVVISVMYAMTSYVSFPYWLQDALFLLIQKGTLATSIFIIVMYMGAFKDIGFVKRWLMPIRGTLSILACLFIIGHVVRYLTVYITRLLSVPTATFIGLIVSFVLVALIIVLGVTSVQLVKRHMKTSTWTRIQKWAYVFYALVYVHLICMLLPSALESGSADSTAVVSIVIYTVLFGAYAVVRIARASRLRLSNKKEEA